MKTLFILSTILLVSTSIFSQSKVEELFNAGYFSETISILEQKAAKTKGLNSSQKAMLAEAYFKTRNYASSKSLYEEICANTDEDSLCLTRLIALNRNLENYKEASEISNKLFSKYKVGQDRSLFIKNRIDFPSKNTIDNGVEIEALNVPQYLRGMGYTFYKSNDLLAGVQEVNDEKKTSFVRIARVSADSGYTSLHSFNIDAETPFYNAHPSYDKVNDLLYFTANYTKKKKSGKDIKNVLQIYVVDLKNPGVEPTRLSFNNSEYNFTHPFISQDGKQLFFTSDKQGGEGGFDIYYVNKEGDSWSAPVSCGDKINSPMNELTPYFLNNDLYFSSYGHKNFGGSDIFMSEYKNEFSAPNNLGLPVNSSKDEFSYVISPDNSFALLTTNRFTSGETDQICKVSFAPEIFSVLNEQTNEGIAEVDITINGDTFSTDKNGDWETRISTESELDIIFDHPYYHTKQFTSTKTTKDDIDSLKTVLLTPVMISGRIIDDITGNPIEGAKVSLFVKKGEDWELVSNQESDTNGDWGFHVRKDKEYKVVHEKNKYITHSETVPRLDESEELHKEVLTRMNPFSLKYNVEKDLVIEIDNIYFDFNSSVLRDESFPVLDKVKALLIENSDIKIELSAHTDCLGKDSYNLWLSQRRAEQSRKYLIENGISPDRIIAKGYGEKRMIVTDCELQKNDDSEAQKNRRVEVKIL